MTIKAHLERAARGPGVIQLGQEKAKGPCNSGVEKHGGQWPALHLDL